MENAQLSALNGYIREKAYFATALEEDALAFPAHLEKETEGGILVPFIQRNKVCIGETAELISLIRSYDIPFYSLMGNHDAFVFTPEEFYGILGEKYRPKDTARGGVNLLFLDRFHSFYIFF